MYAKIENGQIVETISNLKERFPKISFKSDPPPDSHEDFVLVTGDPAPPQGKRVKSRTVTMQDGKPCFLYAYEDIQQQEINETEVRLEALETKAGITQADKDAARLKIANKLKKP